MSSFRFYLIALLIFFLSARSFASHIRGVELIYHFTSTHSIQADIIMYTSTSAATRDSMPIHWGDYTADEFLPLVGTQLCANGMQRSVYSGSHTFSPVPGGTDTFYILSITEPNRNSDIININNSVNVPLYAEDTIWFRGQSIDSSPIFLNNLCGFTHSVIGDTVFYDPDFYDADGDSVIFALVSPLQGLGTMVPGYISPEHVIAVSGDTNYIDRSTGHFTWFTPRQTGFYDIAILTRQYRSRILIGTAIRDILITVLNEPDGIVSVPDSHPFVKIYPDPTQDILTIHSSEQIQTANLFSADGKVMLQKNIDGESHWEIDVRALPAGYYFLSTKDVQGASYYTRFSILR